MAKIVLSSDAPSDLNTVAFGYTALEVSDLPFETDDADIISAAQGVPYLQVEDIETEDAAPDAVTPAPVSPAASPAETTEATPTEPADTTTTGSKS